jgi:ADP-ribose pyrophosphatase YjhB (NUDIX family)
VTPTLAVGAIVFDDDGRVLLVQRAHPPGVGLWTVPGGKLEPGEALVDAVAREVREETGVVVEVGALACVVERIGGGGEDGAPYHFVILDYAARAVGGQLAAASDAQAARWVAPAELAELPVTDGLRDVLARAAAARASPPGSAATCSATST